MKRSFACLLAAAAAVAGCEITYEPDVGPLPALDARAPEPADSGSPRTDGGDTPAPVTGPCADSDPEVDVSFELDVQPLTFRSPGGCGCHATGSTSGFNLGSYVNLRRGGVTSGTDIVVPGAPCDSVLVQKLGPTPPFGSRMPNNGPPYFTEAELTLVKDWIAEGARDN